MSSIIRRGAGYGVASLAVLLGSMVVASAAVDVTAITAAGVDVGTIGAAVLAVIVAAMAFKWFRKAM